MSSIVVRLTKNSPWFCIFYFDFFLMKKSINNFVDCKLDFRLL